jgi:hypothetical protein
MKSGHAAARRSYAVMDGHGLGDDKREEAWLEAT